MQILSQVTVQERVLGRFKTEEEKQKQNQAQQERHKRNILETKNDRTSQSAFMPTNTSPAF